MALKLARWSASNSPNFNQSEGRNFPTSKSKTGSTSSHSAFVHLEAQNMATASLSAVLPEPKFRDESQQASKQNAAPSVDTQALVKATGAPPYGRRSGWIPRTLDDYGDGGAFPEINIAQYPLEMGKKKTVRFLTISWTNDNRLHLMHFSYKSMERETFSTMQ